MSVPPGRPSNAARNCLRGLSPRRRGNHAGHLADSAEESFERQAAPPSIPWARLARSTVRQRRRRGYGAERLILTRSGDLRGSILADSDATSAVVGTNIEYAAIHQLGGRIARGTRN